MKKLNINMNFKNYIFKEQDEYFGEKIGSVLSGVHELLQGGQQVGERLLIDYSEDIVGQIRKILHNHWSKENKRYLYSLQKCGVAIMKAIDEKGNLRNVLNSVKVEIEGLLKDLKVPINQLGKKEKDSEEDVENQEK